MFLTRMVRDRDEAERIATDMRSQIGAVSRYGRITDTLVGVEIREVEFTGRPLYQVIPQVNNRDPLVDG